MLARELGFARFRALAAVATLALAPFVDARLGTTRHLRAAGGRRRDSCVTSATCAGRYAVEPEPMTLEQFRKRPGVERYLVAELNLEGGRANKFASLLRKHFGLDKKTCPEEAPGRGAARDPLPPRRARAAGRRVEFVAEEIQKKGAARTRLRANGTAVRAERARLTTRLRRLLPYFALFAAWTFFYANTLVTHVRAAFNGVRVSDDARIVLVHFLHYSDPELFANDPIGEYHARGTGAGFFTLYYLAAKLGDPLLLGKILPYALLALTLAGVFVAAHELAGKAAAFTGVALCLGTAIIMQRLAGGLPRAFAYPFLAWMAAALCLGRVRLLAVLSATGALFYPILPVIGGLSLALLLLAMQPADRGEASSWSLRKRAIVLALTLAASAAALAPFALAMRPYGPTIKESMLKEFPEAGPDGRADRKDRPPFPPFFVEAARLARATMVGEGRALVPSIRRSVKEDESLGKTLLALLAAVASIGFVRLAVRESNARRLTALGAATFVGYALANAVTPSLVLPQRYAQYAVPVLVAIALPASARGLCFFFAGGAHDLERRAPAVVFGFGITLLCLFGGRGDPISGLHHRLAREDERLFAAVRKLPKDALVAGFPRGAMDDLPIATERAAFLTHEIHMPYHAGMTLLMRERMHALIDAYFARDLAPIRRLRDQHQVTHLLVDAEHFADEPPSYFAPFDTRIRERFRTAHGDFAVLKAREGASVFGRGHVFLLDLERLR